MKNAMKIKNRVNDRNMDFVHLDTITFAPVGNPNVSDRRNDHFRTSYQTQYYSPGVEPKQLSQSQSQPVNFWKFQSFIFNFSE